MMKRRGGRLSAALLAAAAALYPAAARADIEDVLKRIELPPGFTISLFAEVPNARSMAVDAESGTVYVGSRHGGELYAARDPDRDGKADEVVEIASGLFMPNGVAFRGGALYVAENDKVFSWVLGSGRRTVLYNRLPAKGHHGWRYAGFGPDGRLYVALGSPCNICIPQGIEGTIIRMGADGSNLEVFARGIRNSVGFDWNPRTGEMFFTDNGADGMGDDIPPDELNRAAAPGRHFGFPYLGGRIPLSGMEDRPPPAGAVPPAIEFAAHTASLGVHFYRGTMFPPEYRTDAFVAQHGSWNRSRKIGYRVLRIRFDADGNPTGKEVFAQGWLRGQQTLGRPVDIKTYVDGSLLVSDDYNGAIYRIAYRGR